MPKLGSLAILAATALLAALLAAPAQAGFKDRNNDRIPDRWEKKQGLSLNKKQTRRDQDSDGLTNLSEWRSKTDPRSDDTDGDGVEDADEDRDGDRVDNYNEQLERTHQNKRDSDGDGKRDGREDADRDGLNNRNEDRTGNDPTDTDTDDDGVKDGEEAAGIVDSFDPASGVLVIDMLQGPTVSGLVTDDTEIECETEDEHEIDNEGHGNGGKAGASHNEEPGDGEDDKDSSGPGGGENDLDDEEEIGDEDNVCQSSDLVPGTIVHEAELELTAQGAVFDEVEIIK